MKEPEFEPPERQRATSQFISKIEQLKGIYSWSEEEMLFASFERRSKQIWLIHVEKRKKKEEGMVSKRGFRHLSLMT